MECAHCSIKRKWKSTGSVSKSRIPPRAPSDLIFYLNAQTYTPGGGGGRAGKPESTIHLNPVSVKLTIVHAQEVRANETRNLIALYCGPRTTRTTIRKSRIFI